MSDTLKIFNLLENDYIYQISSEDREIIKEKVINSYYSQSTKDELLFELNKEKINLKTIEEMVSIESGNNPRVKEIKRSMFFNLSLFPITFFIYFLFLSILKKFGSSDFVILAAVISASIVIFSGFFSFYKSSLLSSEKDNLEICDDIKKHLFKITLNNHKIKVMILNELKNNIEDINKITNGNKKAINLLEEHYYEIEETLLEKEISDLDYLKDHLLSFLEVKEEYNELYKNYNEVKNDELLTLHY